MSLGIFLSVDVNRPMLKFDKCGNVVDKVLLNLKALHFLVV